MAENYKTHLITAKQQKHYRKSGKKNHLGDGAEDDDNDADDEEVAENNIK